MQLPTERKKWLQINLTQQNWSLIYWTVWNLILSARNKNRSINYWKKLYSECCFAQIRKFCTIRSDGSTRGVKQFDRFLSKKGIQNWNRNDYSDYIDLHLQFYNDKNRGHPAKSKLFFIISSHLKQFFLSLLRVTFVFHEKILPLKIFGLILFRIFNLKR